VSLDGVRFEIPAVYRHLEKLTLRYARWDLSEAEILCDLTFKPLARIRPIDKLANANAIRREIDSHETEPPALEGDVPHASSTLAWGDENLPPLLARLLRQHEEDFRAPGYIPLSNGRSL
jgi:hypothetical protein